MRRHAHLPALLLATLLLVSCGKGEHRVRYFSYLDEPNAFCLSGQINGLAFTATLQSDGRATTTEAGTPARSSYTLLYLSPPALAGVRVHYDAQTGDVSIRLGELHAQGEVYAALGTPAALLLCESPVTSAGRQADGSILFETMDGAERTLDAQGRPIRLKWSGEGRSIEMQVE